ncbi:hypothetical protein C0580_04145 [Candidatus Parcubacteria bacterium]|nr:MAG: hypothetical protein C0580_04145 [Candidatus Parcubacteria bacterium]
MKKVLAASFFSLLSLFFIFSTAQAVDVELTQRLRGFILLQVEEHGEAWYVVPQQDARIYMKDGEVAYDVMRNFSLGISNSDLAKIPVGVEERFECVDNDNDGLCNKLEEGLFTDINDADSDDDGYSDGTEVLNYYDPLNPGDSKPIYDYNLANRLKGYILLQVEKDGQAWYVNPNDGHRYYMKDGPAAYQIMRFLSLGISNNDLAQVPVSSYQAPSDNNDDNSDDNDDTSDDTSDDADDTSDDNDDTSDDTSDDDSGGTITPECGNGVVEQGEECDGSAADGYQCNDQCQLVEEETGSGPICGNGVVEQGEECDGSAPAGYLCTACQLVEEPPEIESALSLLQPYSESFPVAYSDAPEGSGYQWELDGQIIESGSSPTTFLVHFDGNATTTSNEAPLIDNSIDFVDSKFGQSLQGRVEYPAENNINLQEGTLEAWLSLEKPIDDVVYDSDPYLLRYKNTVTNDGFYLLIHGNDVLNFTMYDASRGWSNAVQVGIGEYQLPSNKFVHIAATWSTEDQSARFYLNGEQIARKDYSGDFPDIVAGDYNLEIGHDQALIDEIRILDRSISLDAIKENYRRSVPYADNELILEEKINPGQSVKIAMDVEGGTIEDTKTVSNKKINVSSPDGYFVENGGSFTVQFSTPTSMTCRYGTEVDLYENLPYQASGTGTAHNFTVPVGDTVESYPIAVKCQSQDNGDDFGFYRQYRILPDLRETYPKISRLWWGSAPSQDKVAFLSKFDMVSVSKASITRPDIMRQIKELNPNAAILMYKTAVGWQGFESSVGYTTFKDRVDFDLRLKSSEEGYYCVNIYFPKNIMFNLYKEADFVNQVAEHMEKDIYDRQHYFDGIWWDVVGPSFWFLRDPSTGEFMLCDFDLDGIDDDINDSSIRTQMQNLWAEGMHTQMQNTYDRLGHNVLTVGNGNSPDHTDFNGNLWEETLTPSTFDSYFNPNNTKGFLYWQENSLEPRLNDNLFANNYTEGSSNYYRYHRYGMSASVIAGVYYNPQPLDYSMAEWWYDEYWVDKQTGLPTEDREVGAGYLGLPVGPATELESGVWRRDFENGIVLVNNNYTNKTIDLNGQFREILGSQDPGANGGLTIESLELAPVDGRVLLRSLCSDDPYQDPWCIQ